MVKVLTRVIPTRGLNVKRFKFGCPLCNHISEFSYHCPLTCGRCRGRLPDVMLLLENEDKRQEYHKTGRVTPEAKKKV